MFFILGVIKTIISHAKGEFVLNRNVAKFAVNGKKNRNIYRYVDTKKRWMGGKIDKSIDGWIKG